MGVVGRADRHRVNVARHVVKQPAKVAEHPRAGEVHPLCQELRVVAVAQRHHVAEIAGVVNVEYEPWPPTPMPANRSRPLAPQTRDGRKVNANAAAVVLPRKVRRE